MLAVQFTFLFVAAVIVGFSQLGDDGARSGAVVVAVAVVAIGWLACVIYEIGCTRGGVSFGKAVVRLRVIDASTRRRPTWRQAFLRWLLVAGVQPLIWLFGFLGGQESPQAHAVIVVVLVLSLSWRTILAISVVATRGGGSIHDRLGKTQVMAVASIPEPAQPATPPLPAAPDVRP